MLTTLTLSANEIRNLATLAGFTVTNPNQDDLSGHFITVTEASPTGTLDEDGNITFPAHIARITAYPNDPGTPL